jgi:hypothetical protein
VTRLERLRSALPNATEDELARWAELPVAMVDELCKAARRGRTYGRLREVERAKQRRADNRRHRRYDESQLEAKNVAFIESTGRRASQSLDALATLAKLERVADGLKGPAVRELRSQGITDGEIGLALGITKQAVSKRFARQPELSPDDAADAG